MKKEKPDETQTAPSREIWLLAADLNEGTRLKPKDLKTGVVPADWEGAGILTGERLDGRVLRLDLSEGAVLTRDLLYEEEPQKDDVRIHNYGFIKLTDKLKKGDYVDVRIAFPDGEDLIILSKKKVMDLSLYNMEQDIPNSLWLMVNEEEILRLSSAVVDAYLWEGSSIYAIAYTGKEQRPAVVTYPVNQAVKELMEKDPNVISRAEAAFCERIRTVLAGIEEEKKKKEMDHPEQESGPEVISEPEELLDDGISYLD